MHNIVYAGFKFPLNIGGREYRFFDSTDVPLSEAIADRKFRIEKNTIRIIRINKISS